MGGSAFARGWVAACVLATACSAGVLDGQNTGGFGTASTTASTTATPPGTSSDAASSEGGAVASSSEASDDAPHGDESTGVAATSGGSGGVDEAAPAQCGNDTQEGDEACDGTDLGGASCADFGFDDGVLACDPACSLITDACFTCGDGQIAIGEACDGNNLDGETCATLGFGGGTLTCSADCSAIVDSGCIPLPSCGDGMLNGGEQCDGNQLGGASCVTQGFDLGELGCSASCTYDITDCMDDLSNCGMMGDFCIFDEEDPQSTCCPAGVGGNIFGLCDVFLCV